MRTLRYLGIVEKTCLRGKEADKLLETIKSMPEYFGEQEKNYLRQYGIPMCNNVQETRTKTLHWLKMFGLNVFISEKTKLIQDEHERIRKIQELRLRLGMHKTIFDCDLETAHYIVSRFIQARCWSSIGVGERVYNEYKIQSKLHEDGEEYFVISKYQ